MMGLWLTVLALLGSVRCEESEGKEAIAPEMPTFDVFLSEATGKTFTYELFAGLCIGMFLVSAPFLIPVTYERFEKKRIVYAKCVPSSTALSLVLMLMMVGTVSRIVAVRTTLGIRTHNTVRAFCQRVGPLVWQWMIDILNIETVFNWILSKGIAGKGGLLYGGYKVGKTMFDYIFTTTLLGVDSTKPEEETSPEQMAQGSLELLLMATEAEVDSKIKEEAEEFYKALLIFVTADEDVATIAQGDLKEALGWSTANELIWLTMSEAMCNFFEEGLGWKWTKKLANMWRPMGKTPRSKARRNLQVASFTFFRGLWAKLSMWEKTIAGFVLGMIIFVFYFVWVGKILNASTRRFQPWMRTLAPLTRSDCNPSPAVSQVLAPGIQLRRKPKPISPVAVIPLRPRRGQTISYLIWCSSLSIWRMKRCRTRPFAAKSRVASAG